MNSQIIAQSPLAIGMGLTVSGFVGIVVMFVMHVGVKFDETD
jgi:hypothetical protein